MVESTLDHFKKLGCKISVKVHFLHSHLDSFPENLGQYSEQQGKMLHQDIKMERWYQGQWNERMMADNWWMLNRDRKCEVSTRKSKKESFKINRVLFVFCYRVMKKLLEEFFGG